MNKQARMAVLKLMTKDTKKFGLEVGYLFADDDEQFELEAMQLDDWVRLIDVSPVQQTGHGRPMRVFRVMPVGVEWYEANAQ